MTHEEKIDFILNTIQDDSKVLAILRMAIIQALPNIPEEQLDVIISKLNG